MKRPTICGGVVFAFAMAVFAVPLWWALKATLPFGLAFQLTTSVGYLTYCVYLLRTSKSRIGTLSLSTANLVLVMVTFVLPLRVTALTAILASLISINRSLLFHRSLLALGLDGLISLAGLAFSGYLLETTASVPTALWSFFLIQSLFCIVPSRGMNVPAQEQEVDPFLHGQRQAEAALERMVGRP